VELLLLSLSGAFAADCEAPAIAIEDALAKVLHGDLVAARTAFWRAEADLKCGTPATPEVLARLWIVEGAIFTFEGDPVSAADSFAAAGRVSPDTWYDALGPDLRAAALAATAASPKAQGRLALDPPRGEPYVVWIDGTASPTPASVAEGMHVVQIGESGTVAIARTVYVGEGETVNIDHSLADRTPTVIVEPVVVEPIVIEPVVVRDDGDSGPYGHLGVGGDLALGRPLATSDDAAEPGVKFGLPVEMGVGLTSGSLWARVVLSAAPLLGGHYLYASDGTVNASRFALGGHAAAGVALDALDLGVSAGIAWPGRITARAIAGVGLGDLPLRVEARLGANLATERAAEPAIGVAVLYAPGR
jgi:hypothetical protein